MARRFLLSAYYALKPHVPWRLRMGLRRVVARRLRARHGNSWPISEDPQAGRTPAGWPGWPQGKKFAFVLTHDVEGQKGLDRCRQMAELDLNLGFRSSFNFVPEGEYETPKELRDYLTAHGFEVGVQDLRHDGKLYDSKQKFQENARSINRYLAEWGAVGFRSGMMMHNLDWLKDLNVLYDSSTFDTDPFEPQPDGVNTVFPFWVIRQDGSGYVELPYTLPQDSTLFLVLGESNIETWTKKLDWIAQQGGLALVNVHPDYVNFAGKKGPSEYGLHLYRDFLEHVARRYGHDAWRALPRDVAEYVRSLPQRELMRPPSLTPPEPSARVAMLAHTCYLTDPRVRREAEALAEQGLDVHVVALCEERKGVREPRRSTVNGVHIYRLPIMRRRGNALRYLYEYFMVAFLGGLKLASLHGRGKLSVVHIHNMPDILILAGLLPKLTGSKLLLDIHDPMPELYMNWNHSAWSPVVLLLRLQEKISCLLADRVISVNESLRENLHAKGVAKERIFIVHNFPDQTHFQVCDPPVSWPRNPESLTLLYCGTVTEHYDVELTVKALARLAGEIPLKLRILGDGNKLPEVLRLASQLGVRDSIEHVGKVPIESVAGEMRKADVGISCHRGGVFGDLCFATKLLEYVSQGLPVLSPKNPTVSRYLSDDCLFSFQAEDDAALADAIRFVWRNPDEVLQRLHRARKHLSRLSWQAEKARFLDFYADLLNQKSSTTPQEVVP